MQLKPNILSLIGIKKGLLAQSEALKGNVRSLVQLERDLKEEARSIQDVIDSLDRKKN